MSLNLWSWSCLTKMTHRNIGLPVILSDRLSATARGIAQCHVKPGSSKAFVFIFSFSRATFNQLAFSSWSIYYPQLLGESRPECLLCANQHDSKASGLSRHCSPVSKNAVNLQGYAPPPPQHWILLDHRCFLSASPLHWSSSSEAFEPNSTPCTCVYIRPVCINPAAAFSGTEARATPMAAAVEYYFN